MKVIKQPQIVKPKDLKIGQIGIIICDSMHNGKCVIRYYDLINDRDHLICIGDKGITGKGTSWSDVDALTFDIEILNEGTIIEI